MYIFNKHGVMHTIPDDMPLPAGARKATAKEIDEWEKEDAANAAAIKARKQQAAQDRAQVVVMAAATEPEPTDDGKPADDGKGGAPASSGGAKKE